MVFCKLYFNLLCFMLSLSWLHRRLQIQEFLLSCKAPHFIHSRSFFVSSAGPDWCTVEPGAWGDVWAYLLPVYLKYTFFWIYPVGTRLQTYGCFQGKGPISTLGPGVATSSACTLIRPSFSVDENPVITENWRIFSQRTGIFPTKLPRTTYGLKKNEIQWKLESWISQRECLVSSYLATGLGQQWSGHRALTISKRAYHVLQGKLVIMLLFPISQVLSICCIESSKSAFTKYWNARDILYGAVMSVWKFCFWQNTDVQRLFWILTPRW